MSRPHHQIGRSDGKRVVFFGGALSQNVVPSVHFGILKINKIDTQIDAEKISNNDSKIIRKNDPQIDENISLIAKG